jgi:(p)ppGpp synthase/HD superfamily hydrolase
LKNRPFFVFWGVFVDIVEKARVFASAAHKAIGHKRKYTGACYTVLLEEVARLVDAAGGTPSMVAAAWLHDVVEDTQILQTDIEVHFASDVAELGAWLTDVSRPEDGNRKLRKAKDRAHLAQAPVEAQIIKVCDLISNAQDICKHDRNFGRVFVHEKIALLEAMSKIPNDIRKQAEGTIAECQAMLA